MSHLKLVYDWQSLVSSIFPHLHAPIAKTLALWSFSIAVCRSCSLTMVSQFVGELLDLKVNTARQRLRELYFEGAKKRGKQRKTLDIRDCFLPLFRWIIRSWGSRDIALAIDASSLKDRFVVLAVSVVYRGTAIPVAWTIKQADEPGGWNKHWIAMLQRLRPAIGEDQRVIVLADRGLYSPHLFRKVRGMGFHPFFRINSGGTFRPDTTGRWVSLSSLVPTVGTRWCGRGTAFKTKASRLQCTLLACWEPGTTQPWLILTDLEPSESEPLWYGLRAWIEQMFKRIKREGFQWHRTRMEDPARVERHWLAIALATVWIVGIGTQEDDKEAVRTAILALEDIGMTVVGRRSSVRRRSVGVFRRGMITFLVCLVKGQTPPLPTFSPEPWPLPDPAANRRSRRQRKRLARSAA